jgi:hypothetical protein
MISDLNHAPGSWQSALTIGQEENKTKACQNFYKTIEKTNINSPDFFLAKGGFINTKIWAKQSHLASKMNDRPSLRSSLVFIFVLGCSLRYNTVEFLYKYVDGVFELPLPRSVQIKKRKKQRLQETRTKSQKINKFAGSWAVWGFANARGRIAPGLSILGAVVRAACCCLLLLAATCCYFMHAIAAAAVLVGLLSAVLCCCQLCVRVCVRARRIN